MPVHYQIPIPPQGQPEIQFPADCIGCGQPAVTTSTIQLEGLRQQDQRQFPVSIKYSVPHCQRCANSTRNIFLAGFVPFVAGFVLAGGIAFLAGLLWATQMGFDLNTTPGTNNSWITGGVAGFITGFVGGFGLELAVRLVLSLFWSRELWHAPMLAAQFLEDSDFVTGLKIQFANQRQAVRLTLYHQATGKAFGELNRLS